MPDLALEIGVEELPVSFVKQGLASLGQAAEELFAGARLAPESVEVMGTPRRLTLRVTNLPASQSARSEVVSGPPWSAAFKDGEPTRAATGFAKKHGVEVGDLKRLETDKGDYVSVQVHEDGKGAAEVLQTLLPALCKRVRFPKQMRWADGEHSFGRPVHWIVSLLDDQVIPFDFAGTSAGRRTRGHRFLAPSEFDLANAGEYEERLSDAHVLVRSEKRLSTMRSALEQAAKEMGGELIVDEFLLQECATLVEEPFVVPGTFDEDFLALPEAVVVSVMRDHQRYFAVRAPGGGLLPRYLNVVNTALNPESIATGNDRVLRARLADARFFVEEDQKTALESRLTKLDNVVFHRSLGTVGEKVRRIEGLSSKFANAAGVDPAKATLAARLAKADLETLIVFEFPDLQGQMGRYYAEREELDADVALAIEDHYRPSGAQDGVAETALGALVGVSDRVDTLVGCFGAGLGPKGNRDPFALRRATLALVRTALEGTIDVNARELFAAAYDQYAVELAPKEAVLVELDEFLRGRLVAHYKESFRTDVINAALAAWDGGSLRDVDARVRAVDSLRGGDAFAALATAFKRAHNITKGLPRTTVDSALLETGAEQDLAAAFEEIRSQLEQDTSAQRYESALTLIANKLGGPIDRYFEEVFVMVDDEKVRENRLSFLGSIADAVTQCAHFHLLAGDA
ncbi:MAG: glycyl-tRNA synthetase beta chain [Polyangiales bacterium]|jgi:glycyl-tRNA synthetase beta chain